MSAKIDHKELQRRLKEDELQVFWQQFIGNARRFYEKSGRQLLMGIGVVLVAIIGWYLWGMKASADFQAAQLTFATGVTLAQNEQYEPALEQFNSLLQSHPGASVTTYARLMRGRCFVELEDYDRALQEYQQALSSAKSNADKDLIRVAIVQAQRSLGNADAALKEIETLEANAKADDFTFYLAYLKGGCYEELDQTDKAIQAYQSISKDSVWNSFALERLDWLEAEATAPLQ
ncbi:MAG: tetratricopeptide repeat protein [Candidatus Hinthialibacter antarcticus]|nr:tetratricopeptide repeat protein [Candidatus Hinthialibacter antarcticus]